ncbi:hypothetical protein [Deinococcus aquiradiocola]|uniref:Uncharacterized protein n=1 Tax=Deinococcus aquiradiocola TaxID=393059 RepID=A0A917PA77_9DEIO|nr:hypothetical protein [Deinococcus aquiradiocola]GGJ68406.1 hypothetical protein GCM10008939_11030 [Deinococcus aquiradiocola]
MNKKNKGGVAFFLAVSIAAVGLANNTGAVAVNNTVSTTSTPLGSDLAASWTWRDFGNAVGGNALGGALAGGTYTALVGTPAATVGAAAGGVGGALWGAATYGWSQAFGRSPEAPEESY